MRIDWPRQRRVFWMIVAVAVSMALGVLVRSTPDAFPYGDSAVTEIYTLQAMRGLLTVGAYSQFEWHHPGPMYFYALVPFYQLANRHAIGLAAGALAINGLSLGAMAWIAGRAGGRTIAAILLGVMGVYLWRADGLAASIWNPHLIVVPLTALIVSCTAVATGHAVTLPMATVVGSFLIQTHVSTLPCAGIVMLATVYVAASNRDASCRGASRRVRFWGFVSAGLAMALWFPPILDAVTGDAGNLTRLWRFFVMEPQPGQSWRTAFSTWADMMTAFVRPDLRVGWGAAYRPTHSLAIEALAIAELTCLAAVAWWARRHGNRFLFLLSLLQIVASTAAGLSIMRIVDVAIGDYQIFWISALGALSWGTLAAATYTVAIGHNAASPTRATRVTFGLAVGVLGMVSVHGLTQARAYAVGQQAATTLTRKIVALEVEQFIEREQVRRPLFRIAQSTWLDGAGVILHVYKHHPLTVVEPSWVHVFGERMSSDGSEDAEFQIADPALHAILSTRPGDRLVAAHDRLFVHLLARKN